MTLAAAQAALLAGQLSAAETAFRGVLQSDPSNADGLYGLGVVAFRAGQLTFAQDLIARAVQRRPEPLWFVHLGVLHQAAGGVLRAIGEFQRALVLFPVQPEAIDGLLGIAYQCGDTTTAGRWADRLDVIAPLPSAPMRSVVIAVLDGSPHARFNFGTLLADLAQFDGEVIAVFNDRHFAQTWLDHPRLDKWAINSVNVGVGRGWNIGLNLAEGRVVHVLNADLSITVEALAMMEQTLLNLPDALAVGPVGEFVDRDTLFAREQIDGRSFVGPTAVDRVAGHCFTLHAERLDNIRYHFDRRLSPVFFEEQDLAVAAHQAGMKVYAMPLPPIAHDAGISANPRRISFMGRSWDYNRGIVQNYRMALRLLGGG